MRRIAASKVRDIVETLTLEANVRLRPDVLAALERARQVEESPLGKRVLDQLIENARLADANSLPICQDTGLLAVYLELGDEVFVEGDLNGAVEEGVRRAYVGGFLRKSINRHPALEVENTGDNTPATLEIELTRGASIRVTVMPKGGGSENVSLLRMLPVSAGLEGVEDFVLEVAKGAAPACPPLIFGVGIGGNFATVGSIAKKALLRQMDDENAEPALARCESRLLERINKLGIGPAGLGGRVTALAVKVEERPCHIACLPAAVSVSCHALRSATATI